MRNSENSMTEKKNLSLMGKTKENGKMVRKGKEFNIYPLTH